MPPPSHGTHRGEPGDADRFTELFQRTHRPMLPYAVRRVADPADAADVVAETVVVAWRRIDEVPALGEDTPWLYGVARRVLASHHRGQRRRRGGDELTCMSTWVDPLTTEDAPSTGGPALTSDPVADCQRYQRESGEPEIPFPVAFSREVRSSSPRATRFRRAARRWGRRRRGPRAGGIPR